MQKGDRERKLISKVRRLLKLPLFILIVVCSTPVSAQTVNYTADLDSIVVTVGRQSSALETVSFSVSVVDSISLRNMNNQLSVKELFNSIPGVNVNNRFNPSQGDKITIRGIGARAQFGTRGIKILLDDIPLTFPDGQSQLNNLNPGALGSVEILRGPSSSLYGNASGGVISISSDPISTEEILVNPAFNTGSYGFNKFSVGASGKLLNGDAGINLYTVNYEGFRNHSDARFSGVNFITRQQLLNDFDISFVANYYNAPYLLNPSSLNKSDAADNPTKARQFIINQGAGKEVEQFQTGVTLNYSPSPTTEFKTTLYGIWRSLFNAIPSRIIDLDRFAYGTRTTISITPGVFNHRIKLVAGFDHEVQDDQRIEFGNEGLSNAGLIKADDIFNNLNYGRKLLDQNEIVKSTGIFSQLDYKPYERIKLSAGLRFDHFSFEAGDKFLDDGKDDSGKRNMDKLSPAFGASVRVNDYIVVYGNLSTAFQTPTANELSNTPDGSGGFNESLKPETIENYELGIRGFINSFNFSYDIVGYHMNIREMLIPYQNEFEETYYRNGGKTGNNGLEVSLQWLPHKIAAAEITYTYRVMKFEDFVVEREGQLIQLRGNYMPGIPKHYFKFRLNSQLLSGLSSQININSVDKIYANDFNGAPPGSSTDANDFINDSYTTAGLQLIYSFDLPFAKLNLNVGVDNLFDKRYNGSVVPNAFGNNFFEPASGRTFWGGVRVNFQ